MARSETERAKFIAYRLLKYRARSENEILDRLFLKGINRSIAKKVREDLKQKGLIDDLEFSRFWIESRLRKGYGFLRIKNELLKKGIDDSVWGSLLYEYQKKHHSQEVIVSLIQKRVSRYRNKSYLETKKKIFLYLQRRGFSFFEISRAWDKYESI